MILLIVIVAVVIMVIILCESFSILHFFHSRLKKVSIFLKSIFIIT